MLTKEKQLSPHQAFFLAAYYAELSKIAPTLAQHLVETFNGPEYRGSMMAWTQQEGLHKSIYQAFQTVGHNMSDCKRQELADEVAERILCHDLRSYLRLSHHPLTEVSAGETFTQIVDAVLAMATAMACQDWQAFETTVERVAESEWHTTRMLAHASIFQQA